MNFNISLLDNIYLMFYSGIVVMVVIKYFDWILGLFYKREFFLCMVNLVKIYGLGGFRY